MNFHGFLPVVLRLLNKERLEGMANSIVASLINIESKLPSHRTTEVVLNNRTGC